MKKLLPIALLALPTAAFAAPDEAVSQGRLEADIARLVAFGTRHTLSSQDDPKRGIGAARKWAEAEFRKTSTACGGCLEIVLPETMVQDDDRVPVATRLVDVVAIQRGTERPNEVVIVQGHIDSRNSDPMDAKGDAPGANDDGSGTALVLEAARVLSKAKFAGTIVYAVLSGEEQGLYGGKLLADYARAHGWTVKAVLNNDIVGNSRGSDGLTDDTHVRVFSEGPRDDASEKTRNAQRAIGGENDSPSRNLSRWLASFRTELTVRQVWRADRMGRGGDHLPWQALGYPAVRFTVAVENYERQHQNVRTEAGRPFGDTVEAMDFAYLAKVVRLNVSALAMLARAPMPPAASVHAAVQTFTDLDWKAVPGAVGYHVWGRRTDAPDWEARPLKTTEGTSVRLDGVRGDDWFFGVSSVAADGSESPVASAVPGGAYLPEAKP